MAKTILYPIAADGDVRCLMGGNTLCRAFDFGVWTKIRIGARLSFQAGATLLSTPRLAFGICSGTTNPYNNGGGVTTNFLGAITDVANWNRSGDLYQLAVAGTDIRCAKRIGTTLTLGNALKPNFQGQFTVLNATKRQVLFLDIARGAPNYTMQLFYPSGEASSVDTSIPTFLTQMALGTPSLPGHSFEASTTIAADEVAGAFNAINISWDRVSPVMYVSDLAIARLA